MRAGYITDALAERCLRYVKSYGLNLSAIDIIYTPSGEYVFLETNPNGLWGFVQAFVPEFKMNEALIECLLRGEGGPMRIWRRNSL
jgi:glutathione synthase/RimK-type ligase-like ATP-grasp enzyme